MYLIIGTIEFNVFYMSLKMKKVNSVPGPALKTLNKVGSDINDARRRRRITMALMAGRAGISRATLSRIENGDPTTSIGGYAAVLFVLGMLDRLNDLVDASHDVIGRQIEDENLPQRVRLPFNQGKNE